MPETINSPDAPAAIGPYSHAARSGNLIFTSGQIPIDPATGSLVADEIETQAEQVFANLEAVLAGAGTDFGKVVKTTVFLKDMAEFPQLNAIYAQDDVSEEDAQKMARRLAVEEGIFAGMSSGGAAHIALQLAREIDCGVILFIVCDRGDRYLSSKLFSF